MYKKNIYKLRCLPSLILIARKLHVALNWLLSIASVGASTETIQIRSSTMPKMWALLRT